MNFKNSKFIGIFITVFAAKPNHVQKRFYLNKMNRRVHLEMIHDQTKL